MIPYNRFYRRFGLLRVRQLTAPKRIPLSLIELPRESVLHYLPQSQTDTGPANDEYLFRAISKPIMMQHVTELTHRDGNPIQKPEPILNAIRDYHLNNRRYRRLKDMSIISRDPMTQVVVNYCWVNRRYRYPKTQFTNYYGWINLQHTFWKQVNQTTSETGRQQFIQIQVPTTLPSLSELTRFSETFNAQVLRIFHTPELLMFLELWKWLSSAREHSVLRHLSPANLDKINLILVDRQAWTLINLGRVNAARKATESELLLDPNAPDKGLDPVQVAKFLLMGMHDLVKRRSITEEEALQEFEQTGEEDDSVVDREDLLDDSAAAEESSADEKRVIVMNPFDVKLDGDETIIDLTDDDSTPEALQELTKKIDEELASIDKRRNLSTTSDAGSLAELGLDPEEMFIEDGESPQAPVVETLPELPVYGETPDELFRQGMDQLAATGGLTAAEQARYLRLAQTYKSIELEDGQTLEEFMQISPESLAISEPEPAPVAGITNQAMVGSTLDTFDSQYIEEVLDKDIASAILSVQAAGFAVTGFKRTLTESIDGDYYEYFIRVVPIDGAPSTIRISIPKVQEDGTFMVGGVTYRFRKQQGVHMPIAKVDDSKVALTSYFAKNFVTRPQIKAADYGYWLCNAIKLKSLDGVQVKDAEMIESFDSSFECPRLFSYLAKSFAGFKIMYEGAEYHFNLAQKGRTEFFTQEAMDQLELQGSRLIGRTAAGIIYVDSSDDLFVFNGATSTPLPSIETMLGLPGEKAPLEYSQLSVMGREIPVGFILAHEVGLNRLLAETKARVRRVPTGTRLSLGIEEYAIRFLDEALVFNRKDVYATLLFSGFSRYRQSIANYNVHEFNQKDVYLNVLEESGMSARILSEVELRYQMFVDPITREILVDMKEPTTYGGLLRRATELLTTDFVPDTKNRVRGYERFAGTVYNELVRSVRAHKNRYGRERMQLDVNPYSVQQAILTDSAKMLVSDINPIEDLKQIEAMSYSGTGGRDSGTMTKSTRAYKKNEQGLVSEATVDSGKVAVNTHTSANPKLNSVRGTYEEFNLEEDDPSRLVSTSALLSPAADRDDT